MWLAGLPLGLKKLKDHTRCEWRHHNTILCKIFNYGDVRHVLMGGTLMEEWLIPAQHVDQPVGCLRQQSCLAWMSW